MLQNLEQKPELNDKIARIQEYIQSNDRYAVVLEDTGMKITVKGFLLRTSIFQ